MSRPRSRHRLLLRLLLCGSAAHLEGMLMGTCQVASESRVDGPHTANEANEELYCSARST
ncbi:MAG: hypothetical protein WBL23_06445 [Salinisphaera sp.]|uniref:hypothetical protein n=1 Tax=Salinisphaera sp. TaxID=1914330 RepID=UPI003C7B6F5A